MKITEINGNLFDSKADVLCHQVNTYGVMGAGIAAEVKKRFPDVYTTYRELCKTFDAESLHGEALILPADNRKGQYIANLFGQTDWGTNYKSLEAALRKVAAWMDENEKKTVAVPYKMSCGLAGGNWDIVRGIISSVFEETWINVEIWKLG